MPRKLHKLVAMGIFIVFITSCVNVKVQTACLIPFHSSGFVYTSTRNRSGRYRPPTGGSTVLRGTDQFRMVWCVFTLGIRMVLEPF